MEEAVQFGELLTASREKCSRPTLCLPRIFKEEFLVTPLPCDVHFPLTDFTGPQDNVTVLISKHMPLEEDSSSCEGAEESITTTEESTDVNAQLPEFPLDCTQVVFVGHQLSSHPYLPSSHPPQCNQVSNQIHTFHQADISDLTPLPLDEARYIASLYSLSTKTSASLPNLWILCYSENRCIISVGCSFADSTLYTYTITKKESIKTPSLEGSKKGGCVTKQPSFSPGSVFSQYTISGSSSRDKDGSGNLTVEFSWSDAERPLCLPAESAEAIVRVSATPGYAFSPVLATYNEICTLLTFCQIAASKSEWPSSEAPCDVETSELSQKIENFLSEVTSPLTEQLDATVISPTADNSIYEMRKDLDFCERLWMFAKEVSNLENLQEIFATVFKALLLGKVQPFVHRNSSSSLAVLLRHLLQCTSAEERQALAPRFQTLLSHSRLLQSLIEIGQEKMKRDYRTFFVGSDITTDYQLDEFFTETTSHSQLKQCHTLCKLHSVLEINAALLSFLNLPSATLSSLTKAALQVYREMVFTTFQSTPVFVVPLLPYSSALKSLVSLCGKFNPTVWAALLSKEKIMVVYRNEPLHGSSGDSDSYYVYHAKCDVSCL